MAMTDLRAPAGHLALPFFDLAHRQLADGLRAWALTSGYDVTDRPYEAWKSGVAGAFTENGQFDVYWTLK